MSVPPKLKWPLVAVYLAVWILAALITHWLVNWLRAMEHEKNRRTMQEIRSVETPEKVFDTTRGE